MAQHVGEFLKEKKQKKNNKARGQSDKLLKYSIPDTKSSDKLAIDDKLIKREARYLKNIAIDEAYQKLLRMNVITDLRYEAFWCGAMHKLGVQFVLAQADRAIKGAKDPKNPAPLFHFLVNKELNKKADPYSPRIKGLKR